MSYNDPREEIAHSIEAGQVYADERTGDLTILVYIDEQTALLRDKDGSNRLERRRSFEKDVGAGRFKLQPDNDGFGNVGRMARLTARANEYRSRGGRKANHYADGIEEAVSLLTGQEAPDDREAVELEEVDGVGQKTASRLRQAGYATRGDFRRATDEELLAVSGIGQANLQRIRDRT